MQVPLQIAFEHIGHLDALEAAVRKEAHRIERFYDHITSARAIIGRPHHHKGDTYWVSRSTESVGQIEVIAPASLQERMEVFLPRRH